MRQLPLIISSLWGGSVIHILGYGFTDWRGWLIVSALLSMFFAGKLDEIHKD